MTVPETAARARLSDGARAERLVPHPSLPLVAVLDSGRPAVHVWNHGDGALREAGVVGGDSLAYGDSAGWQRIKRTPDVAWHPDKALLLIAGEDGVTRWTASGAFLQDGPPPGAAYRRLAFSPDGRTPWAAPPASPGEDRRQYYSDAIDLASGTTRTGRSGTPRSPRTRAAAW